MKRPLILALIAAALFGAATPASKALLSGLSPFQLAGLLYLGAALAMAPGAWRGGRVRFPGQGDSRNRLLLLGAIASGGIVGPILLLAGLRLAAAASVSLWLSFEVAATAVLGVLFFRDHLGWTGWAGVASTFAGVLLLSLAGGTAGLAAGSLLLLACLAWGLDNHLTALIDGITPSESTFWKGLVAGGVNLAIGLALHPVTTHVALVGGALLVGAFAYGVSITLYITSAQELGSTRAQVAFQSAPFFGVVLSALCLGEPVTAYHLGAGALSAAGVGFLALESHSHAHEHQLVVHEHTHSHHDGHHGHEHSEPLTTQRHSHRHSHATMTHSHPHWPDLHHRHRHGLALPS